ncbi:MAG: hypothetical protein OXH15_16125 [Gammaproteobacteria bacterium]|nr:hypothetical protein [Gammaproteobacteria bacterium]
METKVTWQSEQDFLQAVARKRTELVDAEVRREQRERNVRIEVGKRLNWIRGDYGKEEIDEYTICALQLLAQEAENKGQEHERDVLVRVIAVLESE